jgi:hypothetical protein
MVQFLQVAGLSNAEGTIGGERVWIFHKVLTMVHDTSQPVAVELSKLKIGEVCKLSRYRSRKLVVA